MKPAPAPFVYWPDSPLPMPPVLATPGEWILEDEWRLVFAESAPGWRRVTLPSELWMRQLLTLDLSEPDGLAQFVNEYGMLWRCREKDERTRALEDLTADLRVFRNVARLLLAVVGDSGQHAVVELEDDGPLAATIERRHPDPGRMRWAAAELNRQLTAMHPMIEAPPVGGPTWRDFSLANVLAVQMFNFAVVRPHVSRCEWCESPFVFQQGRSEYGGHRADRGVKYCTHSCAQAAARKTYREKIRAEKARGGEKA